MQDLYKVARGLETISRALEDIPGYVYVLLAVITAALLLTRFLIIPRSDLSEVSKQRFQSCVGWISLFFYVSIVLLITVFSRESKPEYNVNLNLLSSILDFTHVNGEIVRDVLNTILFFPVGMLLFYRLGKRRLVKSILLSLCFSLLIELIQLVFKLGYFDVNDLIFNTLGGMIGFWLIATYTRLMTKRRSVRMAVNSLIICLGAFLVLCIGVFGIYHFMRVRGMEASKINISNIESFLPQIEDVNELEKEKLVEELRNDPSIVWYGGKPYRYNENLTTILAMGIDQRSAKIEQKLGISGESGQADTIFLIVMDTKKDKMKMISISRDTMCPVKTFDYKGNYIGDSKNHLGLAYAFGDGKHQSCQYMVDTVSNLFYGLPIHAYVALNMEAIVSINDAIGGVKVTVPEDLTKVDKQLYEGNTLALKGKQALRFIKWRDTSKHHSNQLRMERQRIYIKNFMEQALNAIKKDLRLPVQIYNNLDGEMVTSITLEQVTHYATKVLSMQVEKANIVSLKGQAKVGTVYDEFYVDEDALYELIINTFYVEVPLGEENE